MDKWKKALDAAQTKPQHTGGAGKTPEEVAAIQKELNNAGFNLKVDGKWGKLTQAAYDAYKLKQMQDSTRVTTEDDYRNGVAFPTKLPSISASNWRRTPETVWLKKGGKSGIHIKPENKGKFTDYCGGKVTTDCIKKGKNSSDPAVRKRATFAANARK